MKKKISNSELANFIAQHEGTSKSTAEAFVRKFFEVVERGLLEDKYVKIKGLGTFKLVVVGERESVNVQTGERIQISGHTKVSFTPDTSLKEQVNRPFAHFMAVDLNDDTETEELEAIDQRMAEEYKDYENSDDSDNDEDNEELEEDINEGDDAVDHPELDTEETEHNASHEESSSDALSVHDIDEEAAPIDNVSGNSQKSSVCNKTENGKEEDIEEHADSPIIPISSGTHAQSPTPAPTSQQHDTSASAEQTSIATSPTVDSDEGALSQQSLEKEKQTDTEPTHDAEDISVSAPHPINTKADLAAAQLHTTSNSMGYTYSEVPARKKKNWWKTATISICALLLMACCYYVGYFRLLCPACGFSPLFDWSSEPSPTESTQAPRPTASPTASPSAKSKHSTSPTQQPLATSTEQSPQTAKNTDQAQTTSSADEKRNQASVELKSQTAQTGKTNTGNNSTDKGTNTSTSPQEAVKPQSTFHKVKPGENLTRIVRRHYGSEAYVNLVIKRNHLKDANNVTVGMVLELPPKP